MAANLSALADAGVAPADLGTFIYTGGTTGLSKGCMLSHNYDGALARQIGICWRRTSEDVVWTTAAAVPLQRIHHGGRGHAVVRERGAIYRRFRCPSSGPK